MTEHARDPFETAEPFEPAEPEPLVRATPPAEPYPLEALGPLRPAAEGIHDKTQAPPAIAAQSVLAVAALAAQGLADVETLHGAAPVSLFLLSIAQSGERKSTCDRLAMEPVRDFEKELAERFREEAQEYRNAHAIWEERRKAILKGAKDDPEAARADLDNLGPEPEHPLFPAVTATDPTLEGITRNLAGLRPSIGIFADEGGSFLGGHGMSPENREKTVSGLSSLWDGEPVRRWRAGDGVATYAGRRVSLHLMTQPVVAAGLLGDPLARGQGLLGRILTVAPESTIGTRLREGHDPDSDRKLSAFRHRIKELMRRPLPLKEGSRNELDPPVLGLSPQARKVLQAFAHHVERAQAPGGELAGVTSFASKAAEHASRIAGVLTLCGGDPLPEEVGLEAMECATLLATHYLNEAVRLADAASVSEATADAERMRVWLLESWPEPFISASTAASRGPFKETARCRAALRLLEHHGWCHKVDGGAEVLGKRRREAWRVVRGGA